jgi:transcription-repair coupling factor (superfamily II helicase)
VELSELLNIFKDHSGHQQIRMWLNAPDDNLILKGLSGSSSALAGASAATQFKHLFILYDREEAAFFYHDLTQLMGETSVFFLPSSYKRSPEYGQPDNNHIILRTEALEQLQNSSNHCMVVTHAEALLEKVPTKQEMTGQSMTIRQGDQIDLNFVAEFLREIDFQRVDFVHEPGQYSIRGSIIDIYSYSNEDPVRIDFFGDDAESIRTFNIENQLSKKTMSSVNIMPNLSTKQQSDKEYISLLTFLDENTRVWIKSPQQTIHKVSNIFQKIISKNKRDETSEMINEIPTSDELIEPEILQQQFSKIPKIIWGNTSKITTSKPSVIFET